MKKQIYTFTLISLFILATLILKACGSDSSSSGENAGFSATIGSSGGTIEVTDPSSPLFGVKVEVPAGALDKDTILTIKQANNEPPIPQTAENVSKMISLSPDGIIFNVPVFIEIPYTDSEIYDENTFQIYANNDYSWEGVTFLDKDITKNTIKAQTSHFSNHIVLKPKNHQNSNMINTNFLPSVDGFQNTNFAYPGNCFGMVSYAKWYFENKKAKYGNLKKKYNFDTDRQVAYYAQEITKLENKAATNLIGRQPDFWAAQQLIYNLETTGTPQLLGLRKKGTIHHAVLVYAYDTDEGLFYIYEPYKPSSDDITIKYDGINLDYDEFEDFTAFTSALYNPKAMATIDNQEIWALDAQGLSQGCTEHTPCQGDFPDICGIVICGSFTMGHPNIIVNQLMNSYSATGVDGNGNSYTLTGSKNDNSVTFIIQGDGITPGIGAATTTYTGTKSGNMINGDFTGYASWTYDNGEGNIITETATWSGKFTVTVN